MRCSLLLCTLCLLVVHASRRDGNYRSCRELEAKLDDDAHLATLGCDDATPYNQLLACYVDDGSEPAAPDDASPRSAAGAVDGDEDTSTRWQDAQRRAVNDLTAHWTSAKLLAVYVRDAVRMWAHSMAPPAEQPRTHNKDQAEL